MRNFDTSQLRFELDSMFQELDTPPSRCCWRCGCAIPCVRLTTLFLSGVASVETHLLDLRIQVLVKFNLGSSVYLVMLGSMVWQMRGIPSGGVISSAAVAVVLAAVRVSFLGASSPQLHLVEEICG